MADKKSGGGLKNDAEVLGTIVAVLIGLAIVSSIIASIERRIGSFDDVSLGSLVGGFSDTVTDGTPLGTLVETRQKISVWATAARERLLGSQLGDMVGRLVDGPMVKDGTSWWFVDFEKSPDGWVAADDLRIAGGWFLRAKRVYVPIAWGVSLLALAGLLYFAYQWGGVMQTHRNAMKALEEKLSGAVVSEKNARFEHVLELIASENPGDWRVAIMEADIMLDNLLQSMGHDGETLGDRLKLVEKSDFATLDLAWDAHKVRNRIAHHGSDFILTHREAKRVIDLYRQVFEEFDVV